MTGLAMRDLKINEILDLYDYRSHIDYGSVKFHLAGWSTYSQQLLVDSVLNGVTLPRLYFQQHFGTPRPYAFTVLDGKKRLMALFSFMAGVFPLAEDFKFYENEKVVAGGLSYGGLLVLCPLLRARFDSLRLDISVIDTGNEQLLKDVMQRLTQPPAGRWAGDDDD